MPNVKEIYIDLLSKGYSSKDAAKEAQAKTGYSVVTGQPINRQLKFTKGAIYSGQYRLTK
jgi:hypothetical protein